MTQELRSLRVAIVGSGASGFFCADYLLRLAQPCEVCMFERNPTPFGLVRDGVAPDRMNIRSVTRAFARIAAKPGFTWYGNVEVGQDISITELRKYFDAIVVAGGASNPRMMDIQGEDIQGCYSAYSFAGWYNASFEHGTTRPDLSQPAAVVIGAGNAALDVARMLMTSPDSLAATDISAAALEALRQSAVTDIHIVARRGPMQARFTAEELEHLINIPECGVEVHTDMNFADDGNVSEETKTLQEAYQKLVSARGKTIQAKKRIHLHFNLTPFGIMGASKVSGVLFMDAAGVPLHIPCGLVIASIGFTGKSVAELPFDTERGIIPNESGRVVGDEGVVPGLYTAGWIKRGADGVIGTNKPCCRETVQCILDDRESLCLNKANGEKPVAEFMKEKGVRFITYKDWQKIDAAEQARGVSQGKIRERFVSLEEILATLS